MSDSGQHAIYDEAWSLLAEDGKSSEETIVALVARGHNEARAREVVAEALVHLQSQPSDQNDNQVLYGALWFFGGLVLTIADTGYIWWGAMLYGVYKMFRGMMK